ncbi:MAG: preprotein translocase subunit SecE [Propionibacteriaceae bacterium]|nr:preprotein translocase subunit SecE [Propionibacteriaceae bacterium]
MAANKADGPVGAGEDPINADDAASQADQTPTGEAQAASDDGYTPADADESTIEPDLDVPSGEELAEEDLPNPETFDVVDDEAEELDGSTGQSDESDADVVDEDQLDEAETEADEMVSTRPVASHRPVKKAASGAEPEAGAAGAAAGAKKNRPTRSRTEATKSDEPKKTTIAVFFGQIVQELKKVSWPTSAQLFLYFLVVLVFVVFMIAFIGGLDVLFGWLMLKLFG